ncbi:MAG: toll/interleukin-1 receptor domain-containing protein [Crocinitomicaceae bacterium]|nr:toll/interleukin-1 receptor domain-containing protein [Crocinitomicaceae bacterium]MBK8925019.1 toll/interleukin-1 receptor domain-containing protein [Crocinitomicaceae bacterium]
MKTQYQLVIIGHLNSLKSDIIDTIKTRVSDLGISSDSMVILDESNFNNTYIGNSPTVGLYFGGDDSNFPNLDILETLISGSNLILPIVRDIDIFKKLTPEKLHPINGFELKDATNIEALVSRILEGLSLLRLSRRLFISYKRTESTGVAIQLFEKLEQAGFDVFLDTHSIRQGEVFQDELWHRLVDTDVVVLLNTKGFLESDWTKEELAKASAMSIGILQVIWPHHNPERSSELCIPLQLSESDFENKNYADSKGHLIESTIADIISKTESLRARSLGARQDNIISEFMNSAKNEGVSAHLQPERFINVVHSDGSEVVIIPSIGVPHAYTYNQSEELIESIKFHKPKNIYLLYDHINIREKWLKHLKWLDGHLPVKTIKILERDKWLKKFKS